MSGYLSKSACHGHRPHHLAARRPVLRPDLIAKLLRERHVARFLVAPDGFGKTALSLEYADTVFSFEHVFWLNGRSPCFLRDLDGDALVSGLITLDDQSFLVVFDDIPPLDTIRAAKLSAAFDAFLERGCEVLVTCVPSCDAFAVHQSDRVKLSARDLLLSNTELETVLSVEERETRSISTIPLPERVAGLRWASTSEDNDFLAGVVGEELPVDVLLMIATMLVLQDGSLVDVGTFGSCEDASVSMLAADYPYLGIDLQTERFSSLEFSVAALARAFSSRLEALSARSHFAEGDALVARWADALIAKGLCERACELVGALCSREVKASWLSLRSRVLLRRVCVLAPHELYRSVASFKTPLHAQIELGEALRLIVLGDEQAALARVRRLAFDLAVEKKVRALAVLILARRGRGEARRKAFKELERLVDLKDGNIAGCREQVAAGFAEDDALWKPLVLAQLAFVHEGLDVADDWELWCASGADEDALALISAWAFAASSGKAKGAHRRKNNYVNTDSLVGYARERLEKLGGMPGDLFAGAAGLLFERARESGAFFKAKPLSVVCALAVHRTEMEIFAQRNAFERVKREQAERRSEYADTHPDAFLDRRHMPVRPASVKGAPLITVNLFGGLAVRIGDEPIEDRFFRRQKVKTLLALLVLHRGREFSRDRLVHLLWPESELECARKNFYTVWSLLRRALAGPAGTCPYLVRHQNGCRLNERLLVTDVARFDEVCRTLLFGQPGADGWAQLYAEIEDTFGDELMPSELENDLIIQARNEKRMQLVDALVAAANRLVGCGDAQEGLWFARAALRRDRSREDAYTALMQAQISAGQRTAALDTYFACRRVLTTELGIDPSLKTMTLYRSIIETEEVFV